MAWCRQATGHYLIQCQPNSMASLDHNGVSKLNTPYLRLHIYVYILRWIFSNELSILYSKMQLLYFEWPDFKSIHWLRKIYFHGIVHCRRAFLCGVAWWRHEMGTFSALLAICAGKSPVSGELPAQRPVTWCFDAFLFCVWINGWVNNREAGDLRRHRAHYDVIVMEPQFGIYNTRHISTNI